MEDSENTGVPVGMSIRALFRGKHHDVPALCAWIHRVLILPDVVCCIIYAEDLGQVDPVVDNSDGVSFRISEMVVITVECPIQQSSKEMILKLRYEVL